LWLLDAVSVQQPQRPQPFTYAKPEAAGAVMILMMGGVSPETRRALYKHEIIKF